MLDKLQLVRTVEIWYNSGLMRTILHVDMDAFFASVEMLVHPEWRGKPLVVGAGPHERGVVSTCSYEARRYGVRSAMPAREAYRLCPGAIFVHPHMELYREVSKKAFETFERYTPYVEGVSVDEAFLDVTGSIHLHGSALRLAESLREEVKRVCGVTCSVGVAPNRLLAKIGSEQNKPDGLTVMPFEADAIAAFLAPKPVSILWGVGAKTMERLRPYGLATCGDVQRIGVEQLARLLGSAAGAAALHEYAFGRSDDAVHWQPQAEKSVSREHTFAVDETRRSEVRAKLLDLVSEVGRRFRRERRWANTARLKLRDAQFRTVSRQTRFARPARDDFSFREKALALFDELWPESEAVRPAGAAARLVGFGVADLQDVPGDGAPSLFPDPEADRLAKRERLSETLDALAQNLHGATPPHCRDTPRTL